MLLFAGTASAKKFDHIPDLAELVRNPVRGEYRLVCSQNVDTTIDIGGLTVIRVSGGDITLTGFTSLKLSLMFKPGKPWDKIATVLLVDRCVESETTYIIVSDRDKQNPREDDSLSLFPQNISLFQQKTRSK